MSKHTPGPWEVKYKLSSGGEFALFITTKSDPKIEVVEKFPYRQSDDVSKANARLIATAPELLAKLKEIHAHEHSASGACECSTAELIAKAEGRS